MSICDPLCKKILTQKSTENHEMDWIFQV